MLYALYSTRSIIKQLVVSILLCINVSSASAQLEFSNWIVGNNTILHINPDGTTNLVNHNGIIGDGYTYKNYHLLSNKDGEPIISIGGKIWRYDNGTPIGSIATVDAIRYINKDPLHESDAGIWTSPTFMLKSPDNKYSYILHNTFTYEHKYDQGNDLINRIGKTQIHCICKNNLDDTDRGEDLIIYEYTHIESFKDAMYAGGTWGEKDPYIEYPFFAGISHTDGESIWILTKSAYEDSIIAINMLGNSIIQKTSSYLHIGLDDFFSGATEKTRYNITDNGKIFTSMEGQNQTLCIYFDQDKGIITDHKYVTFVSTSQWSELSTTGEYLYFTRVLNNENTKRGLYRIKTVDFENGGKNYETISDENAKFQNIRIGIDGNIYLRNGKTISVVYNSETDNPRLETLYTGDDIPDADIHFPNYLYTYELFACKSDCDRNASFSFPDPRNEIIAYEWDFGDGAKSTETTPTHQYEEYGSYTVSLKVTLKNGTYKILPSRKIILLDQKPSAKFDNAQVCNGEPLKIILNGKAPYNIFYTFNGENKTITTSDTEYQMDNIAGRYQITKVADQMCETSIKENNTAEILSKLKKITIKANND